MIGEGLALLAALSYGVAAVSIVKSKPAAKGDNGVFLSVLLLLGVSALLWLGWGRTPVKALWTREGLWGCGIFALAGLSSNILARQSMYRATEQIGALPAGMLRRLTPIFALPFAFVLLAQIPSWTTVLGGATILCGVWIYMRPSLGHIRAVPSAGVMLGVLSALAYALAYSLRAVGLNAVPDAALGTMIGALVAVGWMVGWSVGRRLARCGDGRDVQYLFADRAPAHWCTASALSVGQLLQFFALKASSVASVAILGTLEVVFCAILIWLMNGRQGLDTRRISVALSLAVAGTALLMLG